MRDVKVTGTQGDVEVIDKSKKTKKRITVSIGSMVIVIGVVFFLFNAYHKIENQILGTWHNDEIFDLYVVFSKDDSFTINTNAGTFGGTYIFVDDSRIRMNIEIILFEFVVYADVSVHNNTLSFSNMEGISDYFSIPDKIVFQRVK